MRMTDDGHGQSRSLVVNITANVDLLQIDVFKLCLIFFSHSRDVTGTLSVLLAKGPDITELTILAW